MIFTSCQKNKEIFKADRKNNELLLEEKSCDNAKETNDFIKTEDEILPFIIKPKTSELPFDDIIIDYENKELLYKYEDIYLSFGYKMYKYSPITNKWYQLNSDNGEEHELNVSVPSM